MRGAFVLAPKRSGSTAFRLALDNLQGYRSVPESHFLLFVAMRNPRPGGGVTCDGLLAYLNSSPRLRDWRFRSSRVWPHPPQGVCTTTQFANWVNDFFLFESGGVGWVEKTPEYCDIADWLSSVFPGVPRILLVRDPVDNVESLAKRGWEGWTDRRRALYWNRVVLKALNGGGGPSHVVKFEAFTKDPETALRECALVIGTNAVGPPVLQSDRVTATDRALGAHDKLVQSGGSVRQMESVRADATRQALIGHYAREALLQLEGRGVTWSEERPLLSSTPRSSTRLRASMIDALYGLFHSEIFRPIRTLVHRTETYAHIRGHIRSRR